MSVQGPSSYINDLKKLIAANDLEAIKHYINEFFIYENESEYMDPAYIFQKVYLHACLLKRHEIAKYLEEDCYPLLPAVQQIAIRQCFPYGRVLLKKK